MNNILFIHPDCSARYGHLAERLAKDGHRVVLLTGKETRGKAAIEGVEQLVYSQGKTSRKGKRATGKETGVREAVEQACGALSQKGFEPDWVCAAAALSCAGALRSLFPAARFAVDFEGLRFAGDGDDAQPDPAVLGELEHCDLGLVPTSQAANRFPASLRPKLAVHHEVIDTEVFAPTNVPLDISGLPEDAPLIVCSPDGSESEDRITVMLRALRGVLGPRMDVHLVIAPAGADVKPSSAVVNAWKKRLIAEKFPKDRIHSIGGLRDDQRCRLFGRAAVFVWPDASAGPSRTLLEAMSSGALVTAPVGDAGLSDLLVHDANALLCDFGESDAVSEMIQWALAAGYTTRLREAARKTVLDRHELGVVVQELARLFEEARDVDEDYDDDDDDDYDDDEDRGAVVVRGQGGTAEARKKNEGDDAGEEDYDDDDDEDYDDDDDDDIMDGVAVQVVRGGDRRPVAGPELTKNQGPGKTAGIDWIVPLSAESKSNNDELRLLLRSIERNARNLGRIILVGDNLPDWVKDVVRLPGPDTLKTNKDGNLINKVVHACKTLKLKEFVLSADDNLLCRPCDLDKFPLLYNPRGVDDFRPNFETGEWNRWQQRMMRTFWLAEELGMPLQYNYETHAPQLFRNAPLLLDRLERVRYVQGLGYGIYTLFRLMLGETGGEPQDQYKVTWETAEQVLQPPTKLFAGYCDATFLNGLRGWLSLLYPEKSRYER